MHRITNNGRIIEMGKAELYTFPWQSQDTSVKCQCQQIYGQVCTPRRVLFLYHKTDRARCPPAGTSLRLVSGTDQLDKGQHGYPVVESLLAEYPTHLSVCSRLDGNVESKTLSRVTLLPDQRHVCCLSALSVADHEESSGNRKSDRQQPPLISYRVIHKQRVFLPLTVQLIVLSDVDNVFRKHLLLKQPNPFTTFAERGCDRTASAL